MIFSFALLIILIEMAGALFIFLYAFSALLLLARFRNIEQARSLIAHGALLGLNIKLAAAFLELVELRTWEQIVMFTVIFALRALLNRVFHWEQRQRSA